MGMDYTSAEKALDKLRTETQHLEQMREHSDLHYGLLLAQAKRVRSASSLAVRELARIRDQLQA